MHRACSILTLFLLFVTASTLIAGELMGRPGLSITGNYISEFAARTNRSGFLVRLSMWGFGLTYLATAATLLRRWGPNSGWIILGCLCLAAAASLLPFVSEYRLWVQPPIRQPGFWDWLLHRQPKPESMPPDWSVRQEVHENAIRASMGWVMTGMFLVGIGARSLSKGVLFRWSWYLSLASLSFFWLCTMPRLGSVKGLVETLAFLSVAAWVILVISAASADPKDAITQKPDRAADLTITPEMNQGG